MIQFFVTSSKSEKKNDCCYFFFVIISKLLLCGNTPQLECGMHVCASIIDALAHDWLGAAIFSGLANY